MHAPFLFLCEAGLMWFLQDEVYAILFIFLSMMSAAHIACKPRLASDPHTMVYWLARGLDNLGTALVGTYGALLVLENTELWQLLA